jgi:DNA gyrase/topoisomerase IV subunit A
MAKKHKKKSGEPKARDGVEITQQNLLDWARKNYLEYGMAVLEDRAIPDYRDGQLPVTRRILYSAYDMGINHSAKFVKSARVVGDTLGRFHPHGDSAAYGAMINMANTNSVVPLIQGEGNWGTMSEPGAAAMRYTEMRLTPFSDAVLFNKFYIPVMKQDMVPNYDGSFSEPLVLPALLPIVLLNGKLGIAPGAKADIPIFTTDSVMKLMELLYSGTELTDKLMYQTLKFTSVYGGKEAKCKTREAKAERMNVFRKFGGKVVIRSITSWDEKSRTLTATAFADVGSVNTVAAKKEGKKDKKGLLDKLLDIEGVVEAIDDTGKGDKYAVIKVVLKKGLTPKMTKAIIKYIRKKLLSKAKNYVLNFTERYTDKETGQGKAVMKPMPLTEMMLQWLKWRVQLERRACDHWIADASDKIRKLELLMLAVDLLDLIVKYLRNEKLTDEQVYESFAKQAKIKVDEAKFIFAQRVIQLRKLEKTKLAEQKKTIERERSDLEKRKAKPLPYMLKQLSEFPLPKE